MNTMTEVELIARQHIAERTRQEPHLPQRRHAGRTRFATTLRRLADHLDD